MKRRQNFQTISWFYDLSERSRLNLDPPYQRRSVWNQSYKDFFIDTIVMDFPAPAIFLYEEIDSNGIATYNVVDGKQRLTSIFEFIKDMFSVSKDSERTDLRDMYFSDFSKEGKSNFWAYTFSVEYLPTAELTTINNIFNRINRNVAKLTSQELRHAKFSGDFIRCVENSTDRLFDIARDFPRIAPKSMREMKDYEFVSQLFLLIEEGPRGYSSDELDEAYNDRENDWEIKDFVTDRYDVIINLIQDIVSSDVSDTFTRSRVRNQADFYSFFGAMNMVVENRHEISPIDILSKVMDFITKVDDDEIRESDPDLIKYYELIRTASNRTSARKERTEILYKIITS